MACNQMSDCNPFFKEKGSVRFSALYLKKKRNLLVFTSVDMIVMTSMVELESLFGHLFDELSNGENQVVSKSSAVTTADASDKCQQQQDSTSSTSTLATTITADGNFDFQNRRDLPRNTPLDRVEVLGSKLLLPDYDGGAYYTLMLTLSTFIGISGGFLCLGMVLNAFIRTADPRKVRIVERPRAENKRPIVTVAKHRTVTLLPTFVVRSSGELSASVEKEFARDASVGDGGDQGFDSAAGQGNVEPSVPVTEPVEADDRDVFQLFLPFPLLLLPLTASTFWRRADDRLIRDWSLLMTIGFCLLRLMTEAITVATVATTVAIPADVSKDKSAPHPSVFGSSSSSEKTDRTLSLFTGRSCSGFDAGSIRAEEAVGAGSEEIYVLEWTVTKGFEINDGRLCANMIDHFTPPAFFKTVRDSLVRMRAEYNILEKRKWRTLVEEKNTLLEAKDKEIEDLKSQLLRAREESAEDRNTLLEQECDSLKRKVTGLESAIVEKDHKLSKLGASSSFLEVSENQSLVDQLEFHFHGPPIDWRGEIDADFTRCCMRFQESFHPHLLNVIAGRRWLLTHGMKFFVVKCLNSNDLIFLSAVVDFNSAIHESSDLNFSFFKELSLKKDSQYLGYYALSVEMTPWLDLRFFYYSLFVTIMTDASTLMQSAKMVPDPHKQGKSLFSLLFLPLSVKITTIRDSAGCGSENVILGLESEGKIDASSGDGLMFSQLDNEARDAVL
ncbi:hypothetical protein Tco_0640443 [Tanacetum coccineum]